jgi:uncharacterized 2Fe-2S/4Fe-4S cluster protein (DUF4445 family)
MSRILFNGRAVAAELGLSLFEAADRCGPVAREIATSCGRAGTCRECIVEIKAGGELLTPPTDKEQFLQSPDMGDQRSFRLACQAVVAHSGEIVVETFKRRLQIATEGTPAHWPLDPWVEVRGSEVWCDGRRLGPATGEILGAAIDVGTTTVVIHLVDLTTGEPLAVEAFENPQKYGGSDVMHRISYDREHRGQLHQTLIAHVNRALHRLGPRRKSIWAVCVAGNPTMRDLVFGLEVQTIGQRPYVSQTQIDAQAGKRPGTALWATGAELALAVNPLACVYGLPIISNHVGADMAAVLGTLPIETLNRSFMVIDIGTNTEVVAGKAGRLICASCPAGPAFEGGKLSCGMPAADGAITALTRQNGEWNMAHIGEGPVRGICGSGLIDLLAQLRFSGEMDELGRFSSKSTHLPVCAESRLHFSRSDASELAQAKAANGVGQIIVLRRIGLGIDEIEHYFLAGAFANHINLEHARAIGLILPIPDERIVRLGNAAIEGARAALLSRACRDHVEKLVRRIEHIELEQEPDFFELFVEMTQMKPIALETE